MIHYARPLNEHDEYPNYIEFKLYYLGELQVTTYVKNTRQACKRFENKVCRYMYFKDGRANRAYILDMTEARGVHFDRKPKTIHHKKPRGV